MTATLNLLRRSDGVCPIVRKKGYIFFLKKGKMKVFEILF